MAMMSRRWPGNFTPSSRRSYGENIASMAWGARNLISTQEFGLRAFYMGASARVALLLVVNSLNELVLKKAWAKDDES